MKFNWTTIPQGWNVSLKQDGCAVSSDITRTGDADRFESIDLGIDLGAALTADSAVMTGAPAMGTWMRIFAPETFGITIRAKNWMLVRIAKEDFILIAIASWHIFSGELLFRNGDVTVRFFGDGHRFASGETVPLERDKSKTNTRKLRNTERAKYEIHNAVKDALKVADNWQKFKSELAKRGVRLAAVYSPHLLG